MRNSHVIHCINIKIMNDKQEAQMFCGILLIVLSSILVGAENNFFSVPDILLMASIFIMYFICDNIASSK